MIEPDDKLLVAVSGGVDSMVLVHLLKKTEVKFGVAHVNYHLRGKDSNQDQRLVEHWCEEHEVDFHLREVAESEFEVSESTQMVARDIRYTFFDRIVNDFAYTKIATAHNANDNLETVLLNLTKGTGLHGLVGIAPVLSERLIRPVLFATKEEVYDFARIEQVAWREDRSNQKNNYQRNLIRNVVVPELRKINPNLETTFEDTLMRIKGTAEVLDDQVDQLNSKFTDQEGVDTLDTADIEDDLKSLVILSEWLKDYGVSFGMAKDIHHAIVEGSVGAVFNHDGFTLNVDRNRLLISRSNTGDFQSVQLAQSSGKMILERGTLTWERVEGNQLPDRFESHIAYFDFESLQWPLTVRKWQEGDVFKPFGMNGKKKVSDFMIDSKIPVTLKQQVMILESADQIMWVVGYRTDDRVKVTSSSSSMLKVQFARHA